MNLYTVFEHEYTTGFDWSDRDLRAIDLLERHAGSKILRTTVVRTKKELQATQHVGVVRLGNRTIQVLPKIHKFKDADTSDLAKKEATRNLLYMLAYAGQLPIREHSLASLLKQNLSWFEILTRLFASHLSEEWQRGANRAYQTIDEDLTVLRGKWRVLEQLRKPHQQHIFSVTYDEFTADNALNRIFRFVVEQLWKLTQDSTNRRTLGELRNWMEEVKLLPRVSATEATTSLITRLNSRFVPLLNLARLFLEGGALQMTSGDITTYSFLFDMNQLFESFMVNFITRHRAAILPPELSEAKLLPQAYGANLYMAIKDSKNVFQLRPDLALQQGGDFPLLVDLKYKRLDAESRRMGVVPSDFYQMFAYAHRYDCNEILLCYPQTGEMPEPIHGKFTIHNSDTRVSVVTIDLRRDLTSKEGQTALLAQLKSIFHSVISVKEKIG